MAAEQLGFLTLGAPTRNPFNYAKFEQISRNINTAWLTLAEIQQQINLVDDSSQNTYIASVELATRMYVEDYLGLSVYPTSYRVWYNAASLYGVPLTLDLPAVSQNANPALSGVTIDAVKYWTGDTVPVLNTVTAGTYYYDPSGNKVVLQTLPSDLNSSMTSPVFCDYTTAANPIANYPVVKQAALLLFTHLYNNRSATVTGQINPAVEIPLGFDALLRSYKPLVM
jgi:hypothetical protein